METLYMCTGEIAKHPGSNVFNVLFVDEHNDCRSLMAEAIGNKMRDSAFAFFSAGIEPRPLKQATVDFMATQGFNVARAVPRSLAQVPNIDHNDVIVLLAAGARRAFPRRPRHTVLLDWSTEDPFQEEGGAAEITAALQRTYSFIEGQIQDLVSAIRDSNHG
jgi:protein-tyrosine-phosphatase